MTQCTLAGFTHVIYTERKSDVENAESRFYTSMGISIMKAEEIMKTMIFFKFKNTLHYKK